MSDSDNNLIEVRAPMSGVFYRRPAPDQPDGERGGCG